MTTNRYVSTPHMIDMSDRLRVNIVGADGSEIENNNREFINLENTICAEINKYNENINRYISNLFNTNIVLDIEENHFIELYDKLSERHDLEEMKKDSAFCKICLENSVKNFNKIVENKTATRALWKKIFIIISSFLLIIFCRKVSGSYSFLKIFKFSNYLLGTICILAPLVIWIILYSIIKQNLLVFKRNKPVILIAKFVIIGIAIISFGLNIDNSITLISKANAMSSGKDIQSEEKIYKIYTSDYPKKTYILSNSVDEDTIIELKYSDNLINSVMRTYTYIEDEQSQNLSYLGEDIIAEDVGNDKEYTLNQLADHKLLIPYKDGEREVLFCGQYNKNYYWEGTCVFNIYKYSIALRKNVLETILEAEYDNGNLLSYKKVIKSTTAQNNDIWSIFDGKIVHEDNRKYARGETWNYFRVNDFSQEFDLKSAELNNIIYIDDFEERLKNFSIIEGYYCGNISNGYYNDDTGNAYIVKYTKNGIIRTLYVGQFKDGLPDDSSGDAWQIVFDSSNNVNRYFYYKGLFKANKRQGKNPLLKYVTLEEIQEIIGDIEFHCELKWYTGNGNNVDDGKII